MFSKSRHHESKATSEFDKYYKYDENKLLGKGTYAHVYVGYEIGTNWGVAVKVVKTEKLKKQQLANVRGEVEILKKLKYSHVIKVLDSFEEEGRLYIVMELMKKVLAEDAELFRRRQVTRALDNKYTQDMKKPNIPSAKKEKHLTNFASRRLYNENEIRFVMRQLAKTLKYLDDQDVMHRDLKPTNILIDEELNLKLTDFNLSRKLEHRELDVMAKGCGTLAYSAPELINGQVYDKRCDIFSLGVIMYQLLSNGFFPYRIPGGCTDYANVPDFKKHLKECYCDYRLEFKPTLAWEGISNDAKDLLSKILVFMPGSRATYIEICAHPWIQAAKHISPKENISNQNLVVLNAGSFGTSFSSIMPRNSGKTLKQVLSEQENKNVDEKNQKINLNTNLSNNLNEVNEENGLERRKLSDEDMKSTEFKPKFDHNKLRNQILAVPVQAKLQKKLQEIAKKVGVDTSSETEKKNSQKFASLTSFKIDTLGSENTLDTATSFKTHFDKEEVFITKTELKLPEKLEKRGVKKDISGKEGAFKIVEEL